MASSIHIAVSRRFVQGTIICVGKHCIYSVTVYPL